MVAKNEFRVRFAPSPTGPLHIGGARSALFNWLLAKKYNGKLILRFEDTDRERSSLESEENIKQALRWLGLDWDEGPDVGGEFAPYRQSERLSIYQEYTDKLLQTGHAYHCFCSEEELEESRQQQMAQGVTPVYNGKCRNLTQLEREALQAAGRPFTVRFKVPAKKQIIFKDLVRGTVSFESDGLGDFVIVKSDGLPVYNYGVVLDDALMQVTHVVRAEEHLSNTPRQIVIYEALGIEMPEFGHVSLILGKDRSKMSKRHGATSVEQYQNLGYLPEAIINFLALLGWSSGREEEIFSRAELVSEFSFERLAKNPAVFDLDKLNWLNAHYLKKAEPELIAALARPHLIAAGYFTEEQSQAEKEEFLKIITEIKDYLSYAQEAVKHAKVFYVDEIDFENEEARELLRDADAFGAVTEFKNRLTALAEVTPENIKATLKSITKDLKLGGKKVFMPVRIALTGEMHGPELVNIIPLIGKERSLARIGASLAKVQN
ncbi:MAG: glutamate--tRNA ligase [Sporomusaceae bacterium]|jgi:nondiscriminating glutamyl-tRNA synthetase|nr:glutamate--tRNA ligase [Sporomusaceae bacterium]